MFTNLCTVTYFSIKFSNDGNTASNTILGKESKVKIETGKIWVAKNVEPRLFNKLLIYRHLWDVLLVYQHAVD